MLFSQDIVESYNKLKEGLGTLLEGHCSELIVSQADDFPLLVLETSCDSVGFAVVNGKPEPTYASAYDSFKHLYRQKHTVWKERNLSFVICRTSPESIHDAFFSSIETDAYFCRKYVLYLHHNQDDLVRELLRLPFLPLPEGRVGGVLRPPSAQTLLQSLNVSARLARQIIVPLEFSANRIVDELLSGKEPLPTIGTNVGDALPHHAQPTERTRIRNVEIEAFRAYRRKQEFDVDADVVVFYGPNGLGKTSFFDALDYVCSGRIGRLCRRRISQSKFIDLARHLGSSVSEGCVSMQVSQGTTVRSVSRSVADWGTALIDNEKCDRASALQFLTSSQWEQKKARIENLERLFRATHLFGQSDPELLVEFEQDSTLASDLVHRMLALDDYASGLAKATAMLSELDKRIVENKQRISALDTHMSEVQLQIQALPEPQDVVEAGTQLKDIAMALVGDLQAHINLKIVNIEPSQAAAREWRAMAESALKDAQDRHHQLQNTESGFAQFAENRSALKHVVDELSKLEMLLKDKTVEHERQQEERKKLTGSIEQQRKVLAQVNTRLRALAELSGLQEIFQKTNNALRQWQLELKRVATEIDVITTEQQPLLKVAEDLRTRADALREDVQTKLQRIQMLAIIQDGLPSWEKDHMNITNLKQTTADTLSAIQETSAAMDEVKTVIEAKEKELLGCEQKYGEFTESRLKLTRLLDEIEAHVENGTCPTCGIDHKSKAALLERIHTQKQDRPAHVEVIAERCAQLRKTINQDRASLVTLTEKNASERTRLEKMTGNLAEACKSVELFEQTVTDAGLALDQQITATVAQKLIEEKSALQLSQKTLADLEAKFLSTTKRINELEQRSSQQADARKRAQVGITPLEQEIMSLRTKANGLGLALEMTTEELATESAVFTSRKAGAEEHIRELTPQIETVTQTADEAKKKTKEMAEKIDNLRQKKGHLEETLLRYEENAATVMDCNTLMPEAISEKKKLARERVDLIDALRSRCITLERTVDAAQRSAILAELEAQAQLLAKQRQTLSGTVEQIATVRKWFANVKETLDKQSSSAVANHVDAFGPLTSLIQKRLRAVYGFGDISLFAKGNEINVIVDWENKHLKPADYFSDSQKQILMLSLFFANRLTQTWSGFAPILMDDPVTHFDDLNAFGFVELIRGLVSTSPGKRQFFISTCEDRLFELMMKKFSSVEGGAKFYRFEGIGPDGPIVRDVKK